MDKNYHIFSSGRIERKDNTVRFVDEAEEKSYLPIENVEAVFLHGQIDFNTRLISFLNRNGVAMHVFGWNDYYAGSIMPKRGHTSGQTLVNQVRAYDDPIHRLSIAQKLVDGSIHNMRTNVSYYHNRRTDLAHVLTELETAASRIGTSEDVSELMGIEATARKAYYQIFDAVLPDGFRMVRREFNPPSNEVNSLISFGNGLVYAGCVSAIRATALDPAVSFLHEPGERRYSLSLDLADVFKPILSDRVLFRVVNRKQITADDFEEELGACLLSESGRKTYAKEFEKTLERTVEHPDLRRNVSYQYLLRLEAYKLKKHLLTGEEYRPFKRWW